MQKKEAATEAAASVAPKDMLAFIISRLDIAGQLIGHCKCIDSIHRMIGPNWVIRLNQFIDVQKIWIQFSASHIIRRYSY